MIDRTIDELGPVDYLIVEFPAGHQNFTGEGAGEVSTTLYAPEPTDLSGEVSRVSAEITRLSADGTTAFFCVCFLADAQKVLQQALSQEVVERFAQAGEFSLPFVESLPSRYRGLNSELSAEVKPQRNVFDFNLTAEE